VKAGFINGPSEAGLIDVTFAVEASAFFFQAHFPANFALRSFNCCGHQAARTWKVKGYSFRASALALVWPNCGIDLSRGGHQWTLKLLCLDFTNGSLRYPMCDDPRTTNINRRELLGAMGKAAMAAAIMPDIPAVLASCTTVADTEPLMVIATNIARNRAAYQSGSVDDDHTAHLATDGHSETFWESETGASAWMEVDLGESCTFGQITLRWREAFATGFRLQASNEVFPPKQWHDLFVAKDGTGNVQTVSFPSTVARHIRLLITDFSNVNHGCQLSEIEVYGVRNSPLTSSLLTAARPDRTLALIDGNWKLQNAMFVRHAPKQICQADFDDEAWIPAVVPGTVLGSYLKLGAIPDPFYGDQMSQISEDFFSRHDFWYRNSFVAPSNYASKRIWLEFDGINWKADVFINGSLLGRIDGAFIRRNFDITSQIRPGKDNVVAVLIHGVSHPNPGKGKVTHKKLGSPTTNGDLLGYDSPTFLATAGWNWLPIVRGRAIGIWNDVQLKTTGDVTILDPFVTTELLDHSRADLTIKFELCNHSLRTQSGKLIGSIGDIAIDRPVTLGPGETRAFDLDKTAFGDLSLETPRLWWPNGYGQQLLYLLKLRFEQSGIVSDEKTVNFGIRKLECRVIDDVLTVFVNGTRILIRGGNWGMADGMLNIDSAGLDLRVRLHRDANLNMIRNWIGMEGHEAFYDACDRYGLLVWDDFWLANPVDGPDPEDCGMFISNARDKIRRVRSHPCVALYCGRNEGQPPEDLDAAMRAAVDSLDGTRHYIPDSASGTVTGRGPYNLMDIEWYFANRGKTLHSEQGIVAVPPVESLRAMMPAEDLWPINTMWAVHDYQTEQDHNGRGPAYTRRIEDRYGKPGSVEDYCRKAQMVNLESARAIFECLQSHQGSGILLWMSQAAWPSLICQLYDHYFEMTAAYFGAKTGCEPLHILWDANTDIIKVANNTPTDREGLTAKAQIYDISGKEIWTRSADLDLPSACVRDCFPIPRATTSSHVFFVKLTLRQSDTIVSDNFYWGSAKGSSCEALNHLPPVTLAVKARRSLNIETCLLSVHIANPTQCVALAIRLKVQRATSGVRVLPVFYSDNYFSLLPGEARTVVIEFQQIHLGGEASTLIAEGWNVPSQNVEIL